jgi:hypothetical protein
MTDETKRPGRGRKNGRRDVLAVAAEARTVRRILDLRAEGKSLPEIIDILQLNGVPDACRFVTDGRALEADPVEAEIIASVRELRAAGMSMRAVAAELERLGLLGRSEKEPKK